MKPSTIPTLVLVVAFGCSDGSPGSGDDAPCEGKCDGSGSGTETLVRSAILTPDMAFGTGFAMSFSADGNTAMVGSLTDDVYVFGKTATGYELQQTLVSPKQFNGFGTSLALSADGNTVIIGADDEKDPVDTNGAAYIYTRSGTTWTQTARLLASNPRNFDFFGRSVAISGDGTTVIIGANRGDGNLTDEGFVDVFVLASGSWTRKAHLFGSTQNGAEFGTSVALSNDGMTAIIGAPKVAAETGQVSIFVRSGDTWTRQRLLDDGSLFDQFGEVVGISGDGNTALVGVPKHNVSGNIDRGAVFVYTRSGTTWTMDTKLVPTDPSDNAEFARGIAVTANGRRVVVGAPKADVDFNDGSAYVFAKPAAEWSQTHKLIAGNGEFDDNYGFAVGIPGDGSNVIAVGAFGAIENHGAMYLYTPGVDGDLDLIADADDDCATEPNSNQANHDDDAQGDACDTDDDNDGDLDGQDNCPIDANADQLNTDGDTAGDACDFDDDNDNVGDQQDNCDTVVNADQANLDNDAEGDACNLDDDGDTVADTTDNCPRDANLDQLNADSDAQGDACDVDDDNDTVADATDNCPLVANTDQADADGNGVGNVCDGDLDGDGVKEPTDNCPDAKNTDQADLDGDAKGDVCDDDDDNDSVTDVRDNCRLLANPDQANADADAEGDKCDSDDDNDNVADATDNCPIDANGNQADADRDGTGDACDPDGPGPGEDKDDGGCSTSGAGSGFTAGLLLAIAVLLRRRRR